MAFRGCAGTRCSADEAVTLPEVPALPRLTAAVTTRLHTHRIQTWDNRMALVTKMHGSAHEVMPAVPVDDVPWDFRA